MNMAGEYLMFIVKSISLCFLIVLPFLYDLSAKFRCRFRYAVYCILLHHVSLIFLPLTLWGPVQFTNVSICTKLFNFISKVLTLEWRLIGIENLKVNESCILVANRQNLLDAVGIVQICSHMQTNFKLAAKKERDGIADTLGLVGFLTGYIPIEAEHLTTSKNLLSSEIKQLKRDNISILSFPENENERQYNSEIQDFQRGVFYLAIREQLPVIPIVLSNYYFLDLKKHVFDGGNVAIEILPPIRTEKLSVDDVSMLVEETRNAMICKYRELSAKLTPPTIEQLRRH